VFGVKFFVVLVVAGNNVSVNCNSCDPLCVVINVTASIFTERDDQSGNQHYSRELLMMGIVVHETY